MRQSAVSFKAKGLNFEGIVATPDDMGSSVPGVVICHPHPLMGGNMDNNVVIAVSFSLVEQGFATIRFNFRGVGNSEGEHTKGELEHQEVLGAFDLLKAWPGVDGGKLGLAGYSFGTSVILGNAAVQKKAKSIALISPSIRGFPDTPLKKSKTPTLIVTGNRDKLVEAEDLQPNLDAFARPPVLKIVEGADHFWGGMERQVIGPVTEFFAEHLK
jgi:alpha/beta superfamily hydrolase